MQTQKISAAEAQKLSITALKAAMAQGKLSRSARKFAKNKLRN